MKHLLWVLQLHDRMEGLIDPGTDRIGTALEIEQLPTRIRRRKGEDVDF